MGSLQVIYEHIKAKGTVPLWAIVPGLPGEDAKLILAARFRFQKGFYKAWIGGGLWVWVQTLGELEQCKPR